MIIGDSAEGRKLSIRSKAWQIISLLVCLPAGLGLVVFAVVNRHPVNVEFWPLPINMALPLSLIVMLSLVLGVVWGSVASWLTAGARRRRAREVSRRADQAEAEIATLKDRVRLLETENGSINQPINDKNSPVKSIALSSSNMD